MFCNVQEINSKCNKYIIKKIFIINNYNINGGARVEIQ